MLTIITIIPQNGCCTIRDTFSEFSPAHICELCSLRSLRGKQSLKLIPKIILYLVVLKNEIGFITSPLLK